MRGTRNAAKLKEKPVQENEIVLPKLTKRTKTISNTDNILKESNDAILTKTVQSKRPTRARKADVENIIEEPIVPGEDKKPMRNTVKTKKKSDENEEIENEPKTTKKATKKKEPVIEKPIRTRGKRHVSSEVEEINVSEEVEVPAKSSRRPKKNQAKPVVEDETNSEPAIPEMKPEEPIKKRGRNAQKIEKDSNIPEISPIVKKPKTRGKKTKNSSIEINSAQNTQDTIVIEMGIESPKIKNAELVADNIDMNQTYEIPATRKSISDSRISGIEEMEMPSMIRDGTFIKNSTFDLSKDQFSSTRINSTYDVSMRKVLCAASPCKLFKRSISTSIMKTPEKSTCQSVSVGSAGCTPMPPKKPSDHTATPTSSVVILNRTRSMEKKTSGKSPSKSRSRVFFKSPSRSTPRLVDQLNSTKLIKSSLKGSSKSFMHMNPEISNVPRKRSLTTQNDKDVKSAKIRRLNPADLNKSVNRLSQPKLPPSGIKSRKIGSTAGCTPAKLNPKTTKGKMPDFASVHKKHFEQMESLVDNKARKEERAKLLLSASKGPFLFTGANKDSEPPKSKSGLFNRFGFRLKNEQPKIVPVTATVPIAPKPKSKRLDKSRAVSIVMRQDHRDSTADKRKANKEYIKGVRTNKRFELQMKNRNIQIPSN